MAGLDSIRDGISNNPLAAVGIAAGTGAIIGAGAGALVTSSLSRKKRRKSSTSRKRNRMHRKIKHTKRGWAQDRKRFNKRQKWEVAYRKRKKRNSGKSSRRRGKIYFARKTGQPYIILASGKARFIKGKRRKR